MKKIALIVISIFAFSFVKAESIDSLILKREKFYQKYSDINIPGKELSKEDLSKMISLLKDIVIVDTKIIKENKQFSEEKVKFENKIDSLTVEHNNISKKLTENTDQLFIIYISGGVLIFFLILFFILSLVYISKYKGMKKVE